MPHTLHLEKIAQISKLHQLKINPPKPKLIRDRSDTKFNSTIDMETEETDSVRIVILYCISGRTAI